jgi:hypothetical protein
MDNFPQTFDASLTPRQEFLPGGTELSSLVVCAGSTIPAGTTLVVVVREGTAEEPGDVLAEGEAPISEITAWPAHVDFAPVVRLHRDERYVIELRAPSGVFWRGADEDRYCAGASSVTPGDLAFETYLTDAPRPALRTCGDSSDVSIGLLLAGAGAVIVVVGLIGGVLIVPLRRRAGGNTFATADGGN